MNNHNLLVNLVNAELRKRNLPVFIFSDRDGTINKDENYYLGSDENWREQIEFLPEVVNGIILLNRIYNSKTIIVTNQSGVALGGERFGALTEERLRTVNEEIVARLLKEGARIDGHFSCPYVDEAYKMKAEKKGRIILKEYVKDNHVDMKPNPGLIIQATKLYGYKLEEILLKYVVGDRESDIKLGLNAGCVSVLVNSYKTKELEDDKKVLAAYGSNPNVHIVNDFGEAAAMILTDIYWKLKQAA